MTTLLERQQAGKWVTANILFLKKQMEDEKVMGDELQMKRLLDRFGPNYAKVAEGRMPNRNLGLEVGETKNAFDMYDANTNPELKPLRESFDQYYPQINTMEGRDGVVGKQPWKKDDFWRIFFDGTETDRRSAARLAGLFGPPLAADADARRPDATRPHDAERRRPRRTWTRAPWTNSTPSGLVEKRTRTRPSR